MQGINVSSAHIRWGSNDAGMPDLDLKLSGQDRLKRTILALASFAYLCNLLWWLESRLFTTKHNNINLS
jgi:hypothetical protein